MEAEDKKQNWKLWCLWISIGVILIVFIIPISSSSYKAGDFEVRFDYTIWDKAVGNGPKEKGEVYIDGKKVRR
jgi:hypothetical protein